jgi:hypothetical protein
MFLNNRYSKIYYSIVARAKARSIDGYKERHHIIPRCLGGDDSTNNLVDLTAREHLFCHRLLVKMTQGSSKGKLSFAVLLMAKEKANSRIYSKVKENARQYAVEINKGKLPITNGEITKFLFKNQEMPSGFTYGWDEEYKKRKKGNNKGKIYITDGVNCRTLLKDDEIPKDWYYGQAEYHKKKNSDANSGKNNAMYGLFFITNGKENSVCDNIGNIPEGWHKGKTEKKSDKKSISKLGKNNPNFGKATVNSKSITINGIVYRSMTEAIQNGYSRRTIENLIKGKTK